MYIVYAKDPIPDHYTKSIFLAGPTPRAPEIPSWRPAALALLEQAHFDGVVFVPESAPGESWKGSYEDQIEWEEQCLHCADCILFWVPRELPTMPAFTTNVEFGTWQDSGKIVFGAPTGTRHNSYLEYYMAKWKVPTATTLTQTVTQALTFLGEGILRHGGEREVPLYIWKIASFQDWYHAQKRAGNRLDGARVVWTFRTGPQRDIVFFWALRADIYVAREDRHKTNEVVISRPDTSSIVMYRQAEQVMDTEIVLVREFRSPVHNEDGFVWELPGGSTFKEQESARTLAAMECEEETGLTIDISRFKEHNTRQVAATFSTHRASLFSVELNENEIYQLKASYGQAHGLFEDSEQTYVEIVRLHEILERQLVDWSMLGMILSLFIK